MFHVFFAHVASLIPVGQVSRLIRTCPSQSGLDTPFQSDLVRPFQSTDLCLSTVSSLGPMLCVRLSHIRAVIPDLSVNIITRSTSIRWWLQT